MKRSIYVVVSMLVLTLTMLSAAWAAETKEEKNLQKESTEINATAGTPKGATVVTQRLEKEFNVTGAQVQGLRDKKLGYGEISIVYSLAQKMPGGVTDANVQSIMTLREGTPKMGWGEIAKKSGTKLGPTVSKVKSVNKDTAREMKHESMSGKGHMDQERNNERHGDMTGHGGSSGNGQGTPHGKGM
jgi:hypothetical protein